MNKQKIIGIIPARMASTRFPGKPLAKICGMPMIGHVWHRVRLSETLDQVYVATCDKEIQEYIESIGGKVVMTKDTHERCGDRVAEALLKIEAAESRKVDIVVLIQGDEPLVQPDMIDEAIQPMLDDPTITITNLMGDIDDQTEWHDPNTVKVVVDRNNFALYFSREPIPSCKKWHGAIPMKKQICIIPHRRDFLLAFNAMEPTPLEQIESIDMMRILEHGGKIRMVLTNHLVQSVDVLSDLQSAENILSKETLFMQYCQGKIHTDE